MGDLHGTGSILQLDIDPVIYISLFNFIVCSGKFEVSYDWVYSFFNFCVLLLSKVEVVRLIII